MLYTIAMGQIITEWAKNKLLYCELTGVVTSSVMDQLKEIPLLENLLNLQKETRIICCIMHINVSVN